MNYGLTEQELLFKLLQEQKRTNELLQMLVAEDSKSIAKEMIQARERHQRAAGRVAPQDIAKEITEIQSKVQRASGK